MSTLSQNLNPILPLDHPAAVAAVHPNEEVLSLDLEENDFLYRIRKSHRIVYASILTGDIIPPDARTDSFRILSALRKIPKWEEDWTTITVRRNPDGIIESTTDEFAPHGLNLEDLDVSSVKFYNFSDLITVSRISDRISRVTYHDYDGRSWILKIARFKHDIPTLQREVSVYSTLTSSVFPLSPRFIGYVYEETKSRTVGFLMEDIQGISPNIQHLGECTKTVRLLHEFGVVHGDLNRYNFLVTEDGAKVFDFEVSSVRECGDSGVAEKAMEALDANLKDETGVGRR